MFFKLQLACIFCFFFMFTSLFYSQPWMTELLQERLKNKSNLNEDISFFEIQKAFNNYWKDKPIEKGKGWKQFKRWEWFLQSRVDKNGFFDKTSLWRAWQEKKIRFSKGSIQNNSNWEELGPRNIPSGTSPSKGLGRINCIEVDPTNSDIIWVGSPSGGLWQSTDGGNSWTTNTDFLDGLGVSAILISPFNTNIMYIATGDFDGGDTYSIGILKSTDGGQTWFLPSDNWITRQDAHKIVMHPLNKNILYVCTDYGILKSTNGGIDWNNTTEGLYTVFTDLVMDKTNADILYASATFTYEGNDFSSIIIKSTNGGQSWFTLGNGLPNNLWLARSAIAISQSQPNIIYVLFATDGLSGVYKSTDSGNKWELKVNTPNMLGWSEDGSDIGGQGWYDLALIVHPTNPEIVYIGGINIWKSIDGGATWHLNAHWIGGNYTPVVHADIHAFEFIPNTDLLLVGCDGGVFKSNSDASVYQDLSNGLAIQQFYRLGGAAQNPDFIYAGAQDNGTSIFRVVEWTNVFGGDGMECAVDYKDQNVGYVSIQFGQFFKTSDGGKSFTSINDSIMELGTWVTPFTLHPNNPQILLRGTNKVYKSTNSGNTWFPISQSFESSLTCLRISISQPEIIYATTVNNIYRTTDEGISWVKTETPYDNGFISDFAIHPSNPKIIWVTMLYNIYKSLDGGNSWIDITSGIPEALSINCIVVQDDRPEDVYIGTDIGVFYSNTGGGNWQDYSNKLPNVIISELEINNFSGKIRAATYGRGLWESPLNNPPVFVESENKNVFTYCLVQNFPNPFNPVTKISYSLPKNELVSLKVYDILGNEITTLINGEKSAGNYEVGFDGSKLVSGVYFYTLTAGDFRQTNKMVLAK